MINRVVITGLGIISSIGNNKTEVLFSLKNLKSGIVFSQSMKNFGLRSNVCGKISYNKNKKINRLLLKFMNDASLYSYFSMEQAILDSYLTKKIYQKNYRIGIINGIGCNFFNQSNCFFSKTNLLNPYLLIQSMFSNISACLSTFYKIYGVSYSISAACSTSSNCIIHAVELIQHGKQDIIFAGGAEEFSTELAYGFDILKLLSRRYNHEPKKSSRPYDINRDGFVISGGAGILVLEELQHALSRNARIYAEIIGFGTCSDGFHITKPSGLGLRHAMNIALNNIDKNKIDYINTHGTATKIGDIIELNTIKQVFKNYNMPYISSTKSITGHALGASGVHEIIYIILMMYNKFIMPSINIQYFEKNINDMNILYYKNNYQINFAISNNCGFGGVNTSIVLKKYY